MCIETFGGEGIWWSGYMVKSESVNLPLPSVILELAVGDLGLSTGRRPAISHVPVRQPDGLKCGPLWCASALYEQHSPPSGLFLPLLADQDVT